MTRPRSVARRLSALAAVLVLGLLAPGCGRPPDEAWLRFLGFRTSGGDTTLTTVEGDLNDGTTDKADAAFQNASITLGTTSGSTGTGITIKSARVDYKLSGYSPPSATYALSLYLPASTVASGTVTSDTHTLTDFPLAPASLKSWLLKTHAFDNASKTPEVRLTANVTFFARTDEGTNLEVSGSIAVVLSVTTSGSAETVTISATTATATSSSPGEFTVSRDGSTAESLTVYYSAGGTAEAGTDYAELDGLVVIAAGESSATITVTPLSGATAGRTVIVTLTENSSYTLGSASKATVTLD